MKFLSRIDWEFVFEGECFFMPEISVLVDAGKATAAAPLGPALGPLGVNILDIVNKINEKTKAFAGMKVPVKILVDSKTKGYEVEVGSPPTSALIKKEAKVEHAAKNAKLEIVGNISMDQVKKVAEMKMDKMNSYKLKSAAKEVIGTCDTMGISIDGKKAREVQKEFREGKFDEMFK